MSEARQKKIREVQKISWKTLDTEELSDRLSIQKVFGEKATLAQLFIKRGKELARHSHVSEEYMWISSGAIKYIFDDREVLVNAGEVIVIPPNVPHSLVALEDGVMVGFFAPAREDWLRGEDQYLRK